MNTYFAFSSFRVKFFDNVDLSIETGEIAAQTHVAFLQACGIIVIIDVKKFALFVLVNSRRSDGWARIFIFGKRRAYFD